MKMAKYECKSCSFPCIITMDISDESPPEYCPCDGKTDSEWALIEVWEDK